MIFSGMGDAAGVVMDLKIKSNLISSENNYEVWEISSPYSGAKIVVRKYSEADVRFVSATSDIESMNFELAE